VDLVAAPVGGERLVVPPRPSGHDRSRASRSSRTREPKRRMVAVGPKTS
jgi:hypothetical protein